MDKNIAIIGAGNLGLSIVNGLLKSKTVKGEQISLTRRRVHLAEYLKPMGVNVLTDNKLAVSQSEIIIVAVKPHQIEKVLIEIEASLIPGKHILISVVTGVEISKIKTIINKDLPVFRAMPNTAISIQQSMTCVAGNGAGKDEENLVISLFNSLGITQIINEELMGAATVIGACGIAFALRFMRAMSQGGIEIGFGAELSQLITAQTIRGAAQLILENGNHPEQEIDKVTTPQGITISGLNEMEHQGFSPAVIRGLLTSFAKIENMNK